ncbi:MAG: hypothetical protein Q4E64_09325 [Phascolarctobacterium sp.]|uniref:dCTP deaminase domain-containing protein n=1 Tax=Phascolarctobacterium sp. TaxID=2049039 RepID=UPI0026DB0A45|nr:hypothetical protein [Phascolarctobacterium sp.]MDO4922008.1 hypothetical protein [Phascolarctobacterium sp.]
MMNYYGIILIGYDLETCKNIADKLISRSTDDYTFVRIKARTDFILNSMLIDYIESIPSSSLIYYSFSSEIKLQKDSCRFIFDMADVRRQHLSGNVAIIIMPDSFFDSLLYINELYKFMVIRIDNEKTITAIDCRSYNKCTYRLIYNNLEDTCELIQKLWHYRNTGGVLSRDMIEKMIKCGMLVRNCNYRNISYASYDLTLGDEYYYEGKVQTLDNSQPFIPIEPYDYIIASSKEIISFPRDVIGRFDLVVNLFFEGIILSNSTQVDPGFNGKLFCLLFNTSNKTVYLKRGMPFSTLEFNKLIEPTDGYRGSHAYEYSMVSYLPRNIMNGAINELKKDVEGLRKENNKMQQLYLTSLAIMVAVLALLFTIGNR